MQTCTVVIVHMDCRCVHGFVSCSCLCRLRYWWGSQVAGDTNCTRSRKSSAPKQEEKSEQKDSATPVREEAARNSATRYYSVLGWEYWDIISIYTSECLRSIDDAYAYKCVSRYIYIIYYVFIWREGEGEGLWRWGSDAYGLSGFAVAYNKD